MKSICVKSIKDDSVVKRIDVTGKKSTAILNAVNTMCSKINLDKYIIDVEETV